MEETPNIPDGLRNVILGLWVASPHIATAAKGFIDGLAWGQGDEFNKSDFYWQGDVSYSLAAIVTMGIFQYLDQKLMGNDAPTGRRAAIAAGAGVGPSVFYGLASVIGYVSVKAGDSLQEIYTQIAYPPML
tara:strand:+ start:94763 stop:95155 length:393 start_codon:yes stop_codon:yes gene_type:complete